ncbi:DUF4344 domain-containing metallopeptidase [Neorhizobium galegae]|uniref:Metallopeptidase DUF4344 n=1 Tax=Neorhizobium galegae bv. orientalis str. HAMBI 540 TaxID=1028800 RepID=A0A068ST32_NEOGA|nr:DUF4344 domain-containing metallopeptidase [Neorhizobium galegae]CDN49034.1 Hypothetical protein RG540_CH28680 [Neorhizobium galegae bv. orientalis str. HAMBI 540]
MRRSLLPLALIGLLALPMPGAQAAALTDDLQGLSKQQVEDSVEFAFGNALFFLFHEAGHMLVSEFNLPVLGREEDAVDTLSTLLLLEADGEVFDTALTDSVDGWTFSAEASEAAEEEQALWDVHALDRQRAFSMVCMMVGKDAEKFKESADNLEFPEERRKQCVGEYQKARDSWFGVLKPHQRTDGQNNKFTITYKKPNNKELRDYADLTKTAKVLDILAELLSGLYKLDDGIKLTAAECGESNAYWSPNEREVTYCYELTQLHTQTVANYFRNGEDNNGDDEAEEKTSEAKPASTKVFGTATARK